MREAARLQSRTTHAAPACLDVCEAFSVLLRDAMLGATKHDVLDGAGRTAAEGVIGEILAGRWRARSRDDIEASGDVAHTLEASLWCVDRTQDFRSAVLLAANLGEDADTTAAVTGQLAGAVYGMSSIQEAWLTRLALRAELESTATALLSLRSVPPA